MKGGDAANRRMRGDRESSVRPLYSLLTESLQDLSKISSRTVCRSARGSREKRKERQHNAREDRETLSPSPLIPLPSSLLPSIPFADASSKATEILEAPLCFWLLERVKIPAYKTLSESSEGVVEDVQETLYCANYSRLTTLSVREARSSFCPSQDIYISPNNLLKNSMIVR